MYDTDPTQTILFAQAYLQKYGYMNSTKELGGIISPQVFSEAMTKFQVSMGLQQTGELAGDKRDRISIQLLLIN